MTEVTVSSKGQIVLPKNIRQMLHINEGERMRITVQNGNIVLTPTRTEAGDNWKRWRGILKGTRALREHITEHMEEAQK